MRERLARFMIGRNGNDQLNRFLLLADVVLLLLASLLGRTALGSLLYLLVLALLGLTYFRMLSRNVYKRRSENEGYLRRKQQGNAEQDQPHAGIFSFPLVVSHFPRSASDRVTIFSHSSG